MFIFWEEGGPVCHLDSECFEYGYFRTCGETLVDVLDPLPWVRLQGLHHGIVFEDILARRTDTADVRAAQWA